jgi:hypothetical protein
LVVHSLDVEAWMDRKLVTSLWLTSILWFACGERSDDPLVCDKAIEKWNACAKLHGEQSVPVIAWNGLCADGVTFKTATTGSWEVPLRSWSEEYMACTPEPSTCLCPGMEFIVPEIYDPK